FRPPLAPRPAARRGAAVGARGRIPRSGAGVGHGVARVRRQSGRGDLPRPTRPVRLARRHGRGPAAGAGQDVRAARPVGGDAVGAGRRRLVTDSGPSVLSAADIAFRFNNWDRVRAERAPVVLQYAAAAGAAAAFLLVGYVYLLRRRQGRPPA